MGRAMRRCSMQSGGRAPVPSGPVRLRIEHAGHLVQTTWVSYAG